MAKTSEEGKEAASVPAAVKFSKKQLLNSRRYASRRDLLTAVLKEGKEYSHEDVKGLIESFMRKAEGANERGGK